MGEREITLSMLSVRHRQCLKQGCLPARGFPLALARVSPAVTHGAPPPEAALCDARAEVGEWSGGRVSARLYMICVGGGERNILLRAHPLSPAGTPYA